GCHDRDDFLPAYLLRQPQRHGTKMKLHHSQQPSWVGLDDQLCDSALQTPFHCSSKKHVGDRTHGAALLATASLDTKTCPLPDMGANRAFPVAKLRHDFREQMRASRGQETLVAKYLALFGVNHMNSMFVIKLINLASIGLGEILPTHFFDKHLMAQAIRLLHFVPIKIVILGGYQMNHKHSPDHVHWKM